MIERVPPIVALFEDSADGWRRSEVLSATALVFWVASIGWVVAAVASALSHAWRFSNAFGVSVGVATAGFVLDRVARPWTAVVRSRSAKSAPIALSRRFTVASVAALMFVSFGTGPLRLNEYLQLAISTSFAVLGTALLQRGAKTIRCP